MKTVVRVLSVFSFFAVVASSLSAAGYLKIGDIAGESKDTVHKGWIDVVSVQDLPEASTREKGSGMATGKRQHKPITITKPVDKATPLLAKSVQAAGAVKGKAAMAAAPMTLSEGGKTYVLHGARVVSSTTKGGVEILVIEYDSCDVSDAAVTPAKAATATDYNSSRSNRTTQ